MCPEQTGLQAAGLGAPFCHMSESWVFHTGLEAMESWVKCLVHLTPGSVTSSDVGSPRQVPLFAGCCALHVLWPRLLCIAMTCA